MKVVKGQLVILTYFTDGEDAEWEYGVVKELFDYNIHIVRENGGRYMHVINEKDVKEEYTNMLRKQSNKTYVTPLTISGKPVLSGKGMLGKYTFEPKH